MESNSWREVLCVGRSGRLELASFMFMETSVIKPSQILLKHRKRIIFYSDGWQQKTHPFKKLEYGKWDLEIPGNSDGTCPIKHLSIVKVNLGESASRQTVALEQVFFL